MANASSIWTQEIIRNIHLPLGHTLDLISYDAVTEAIEGMYQEEFGVTLKQLVSSSGNRLLKKTTAFLAPFRFLAKNRVKFDVAVVHYPPNSVRAISLIAALKMLNCKIVTVFWGSDILALGESKTFFLERIIEASDRINLSTEKMSDEFARRFGQSYSPEIHHANFGTLALPYLDSAIRQYGKAGSKRQIGLSEDKLTIAIGHNGATRQNHIKVIDALSSLDYGAKARVQLLLHIPGATKNYVEDIGVSLESCGIDHVVLTEGYPLADIAKVRVATDIFLHAQQSDGLSSSVRECLYSDSILVNPKWISYKELDRLGIEYVTYDAYDELPGLIRSILDDEIVLDTKGNKEIIGSHYSWQTLCGAWRDLLEF
ncbi:hypothetical protein VIN30_04570 [Adlercreutzia sp. R7]|uniref:Glycosyltransferase n=1 Tax=Adlercreutzia wanghongyangiae TaxID=3111451 RepID=A0ABU6IH57_9ACTN|nr:hypothetical protein [Adlercreutzia sp. R7]